jgi:uncharacterized protein (TIGR03437 family)
MVFAAILLLALTANSQTPGPLLSIDANANRHPISPDIYGISFYWTVNNDADRAAAVDIRPTVRRWGGNSTSTYHWQFDVQNIDSDWFYEVLPDTTVNAVKLPEGSTFNAFADQVRTTGGKIMGTVPILGWLPKARAEMCSFNLAKYPNQCKVDPYAQYHPVTCGNGITYTSACGDPSVVDGKGPSNPTFIKNDPTDAYAPSDESFQADWIRYLVSRYGKANQGGVSIWSLDNEPIWWDNTHRDIHPNPYTYDEVLGLNMKYAQAIKSADPTALVSGPVGDNWASLWLSKKDIVAGQARGNYWSNPIDRNAHGGVAFLPWYLQQMKNYEQQTGTRLLDYLDLHAYIEPSGVHTSTDNDTVRALRLASTREFWDPAYMVSNDYWIKDVENGGGPVAPRLIPRLREMVAQNYPGTKIAITEYNWTALDTISGGLAQAELLGIFGREGLDLANLWGPPKPTDPGAFAFKMFRNYDGAGNAFGETGIQAGSDDQGKLSVFAALRTDLNLTALVINKTNGDLSSTLNLANYAPGSTAKVWRYSGARLDSIVAQPDVPVSGASLATVFPAYSMTLLVIPLASLPVPKPSLAAVTNAASYAQQIAPGQTVVLFGANMGPAKTAALAVDANGLASTISGGVRVLFDGVPAPIIYAGATQISAVVPYFGATKATTHVQVEYQGVRSESLAIPVAATAPGLFSADFTGKGQGAIFNQDGITRNGSASPASPGSIVTIWGTGEGITNPPGVDGRAAIDVLPKPVASVSVDIGGLPASITYAGAAPGVIPGVFQINAQIPDGVQPGNQVPVHVVIGGKSSQDGLTIAVR